MAAFGVLLCGGRLGVFGRQRPPQGHSCGWIESFASVERSGSRRGARANLSSSTARLIAASVRSIVGTKKQTTGPLAFPAFVKPLAGRCFALAHERDRLGRGDFWMRVGEVA